MYRRYLYIVLLALAACSGYDDVRNLDSRGTAIIAFGDSLTAGYGAQAGEDYPTRLSQRISADIINAGVNGDTTESALQRLDSDVLAQNPRIVIIGLGGNDFLRGVPIEITEQNLNSIVRRVHGAGAIAVVLGYRFPTLRGGYEGMYERVAEANQAMLIPDLLDGILSDPALKSDAVHPNGRGYLLMTDRLVDPLQELIAEADRARRP